MDPAELPEAEEATAACAFRNLKAMTDQTHGTSRATPSFP